MEEENDSSLLCKTNVASELLQLNVPMKVGEDFREKKKKHEILSSPLSGNGSLSNAFHNCGFMPTSSADTSSSSSGSECLPVGKYSLNKICNNSSARTAMNSDDHACSIASLTCDASSTTALAEELKITSASNSVCDENKFPLDFECAQESTQKNNLSTPLCFFSKKRDVDDFSGKEEHQYMDMSPQCSDMPRHHECTSPKSAHCSEESGTCHYDVVRSDESVYQLLSHNSSSVTASMSGIESDMVSNVKFGHCSFCHSKLSSSFESSTFSWNIPDLVNISACYKVDPCCKEAMSFVHVSPGRFMCNRNHNEQLQLNGRDGPTWRSTSELCKCSGCTLKAYLPQHVHHKDCTKKFWYCGQTECTDAFNSDEPLCPAHASFDKVLGCAQGCSESVRGFHFCAKSPVKNIGDSNVPSSEARGFCCHNSQQLTSKCTVSSPERSIMLHEVKPRVCGVKDIEFHQKRDHYFEGHNAVHGLQDMNEWRNSDIRPCNTTSSDKSELQCYEHRRECHPMEMKSICCKFGCSAEHSNVVCTGEKFTKCDRSSELHPGSQSGRLAARCTSCHSYKSEKSELCFKSRNCSCNDGSCQTLCRPQNKLSLPGSKWDNPVGGSLGPTNFQILPLHCSNSCMKEPVQETFRSTSSLTNLQSNHSLKKKVIQKFNRHKFRSPFKQFISSTYQRKTRPASFWMTCMSLASKAGISRSVPSTSKSSWEENCLGSPCGTLPSNSHQDDVIPEVSKPNRLSSDDACSTWEVEECSSKVDSSSSSSSLLERFPVPELQRKLLSEGALQVNESSDFSVVKGHIQNSDNSSCPLKKTNDKLMLTTDCNSMLELKLLLEKSLQLKSACSTLQPLKSLAEQEDNVMNDDSNVSVQGVHTQVDYIHCLVPDLLAITGCSFYWGKMDRYEAENLLNNRPEGTFLLRDSAQTDYLFSVSFRRYGKSLHARVEQENHKFSFDCHDPDVFASDTVSGLIQHYKDPSCCMFFEPMLTIPLCRSFPFPLQHLCRAAICSSTTYDGINKLKLPKVLRNYLKEYHYKQLVRIRRFDQ